MSVLGVVENNLCDITITNNILHMVPDKNIILGVPHIWQLLDTITRHHSWLLWDKTTLCHELVLQYGCHKAQGQAESLSPKPPFEKECFYPKATGCHSYTANVIFGEEWHPLHECHNLQWFLFHG